MPRDADQTTDDHTVEHICYLTSDIDSSFSFKVYSVEGCISKYHHLPPDKYHIYENTVTTMDIQLTVQLFAEENLKLCDPFCTTLVKAKPLPLQCSTNGMDEDILCLSYVIDQVFTFPIQVKHLPNTSFLRLTLLLHDNDPFAFCTFPLFSRQVKMRSGQYRLPMYDDKETISMPYDPSDKTEKRICYELKKYEFGIGEARPASWLDKEALRSIRLFREEKMLKQRQFYIAIGFVRYDEPLYYQEEEGAMPPSSNACITLDPEMEFVLDFNPIDFKIRQLTRSARFGPLDKELKPTTRIRDQLACICSYQATRSLTAEEKDLVWRYRYYLTREKRAITKLFKSIDWDNDAEWKHVSTDLLKQWTPPLDIEDMLELLSDEFSALKQVRQFAVEQLAKMQSVDCFQLFLPQLVQATLLDRDWPDGDNQQTLPALASYLVSACSVHSTAYIQLYWYLKVECEQRQMQPPSSRIHPFQCMMSSFLSSLTLERKEILSHQSELIHRLLEIAKEIKGSRLTRSKKHEKLYSLLSDISLNVFDPTMPLPLDPDVIVKGICASEAQYFKSNLSPLKLPFIVQKVSSEENVMSPLYDVIFKIGDDLRQDQLIVQMIQLMDSLLQKEHLDLKLSPYKVLATGSQHGMIQYVKSETLASILEEFAVYDGRPAIQFYLQRHFPDEDAPFGIETAIMNNYICSCAGYCVITYLLGVGDRHLDNLLLTPDGRLFHIDFAYILGSDPKPFPPPMKLCREMVEAMGGATSHHYQKFKNFCYLAFSILRKSSHLIINLFALMKHTSLPDIALEPGDRVLFNIQEKFRLDLSEAEAHQWIESLLQESVTALFPQVMEAIHKWAQYWRK